MITGLTVQGFKRFLRQEFNVCPITLLTGLNGSGKTSLIQILILAREATRGGNTVRLNDLYNLNLGTASDVRNWETDSDLGVKISAGDGESYEWTFGYPSDEALYLAIKGRPGSVPEALSTSPRSFNYLSAERLGPRNVQAVASLPQEELEVGPQGEFCAQVLEGLGTKPLQYSQRLHPQTDEKSSTLLKYEVERWLGDIARPVEIEAERYQDTSIASLKYRPLGGDLVRAPNMGFGVTYALPIVLAGLLAKPNGILVVENPEAHLHPAGQSAMGVFLTWLAGKGVQVLVETHSDHVLNGVRKAIGIHQYLPNTQAVVHYFEGNETRPNVNELKFTELGGISHWPRGFFDQFQIDVAALGRVRRKT